MEGELCVLSSQVTQPSSKYTYRHLSVLSSNSPAKESPLRIISLCDLDCFYAQVEGVRIKADPDEPLAVSQWGGLIAINYAARAAGITRHENALSAVQKCPGLRLVHVQTWKEGDTVSRYHDEPTVVDHKVSLDPYRRESRKILEIFKKHCDRVEKASIDESFLDLSSMVKFRLMERYRHLLDPDPSDLDSPLPEAPYVHWTPELGVLIDLDTDHAEEDKNDWDDVVMHIAAELMKVVRQDVKDTLGYTCSAGIARNKTLAKIAAGQNKPAKQTLLRNRAVQSFLNNLPFTKIRNLGGKLGVEVERAFETSSVRDITSVSIVDLRKKLGTETGQWLYNIVRGIDYAEVSTNTQVKSMLSAKSFRPQIDSLAQAARWIKVLTADLASRLQEDPNQRRPRTMTMHHRVPGSSKTRQTPILRGCELSNEYLASLGIKLLMQINTEGLESGVQDIGGFFKRAVRNDVEEEVKVEGELHEGSTRLALCSQDSQSAEKIEPVEKRNLNESPGSRAFSDSPPRSQNMLEMSETASCAIDGSFKCDRCANPIFGETEVEHQDWHFARDLSRELSKTERGETNGSKSERSSHTAVSKKSKTTRSKTVVEKGQKRLKF